MRGKSVLQVLNILVFLGVVAVNYAANAVPIGGVDTGEVADMYPNLFTPAGFTFSIWGVIYLLLLGFAIYQARDLFSSQKIEMPFMNSIGYLFFITCLLNIGWIFTWHYLLPGLSLIIMILFLLTLIKIYVNLGVGFQQVNRGESILVYLPFRIYLGWITIATIANVTAWLVHIGWDGFGIPGDIWTVVVIAAAVVITMAFLKLRHDVVIGLVSIWSLFGILMKRLDTEPVEMTVVIAVVIALAIIGIYTAITAARSLMTETK